MCKLSIKLQPFQRSPRLPTRITILDRKYSKPHFPFTRERGLRKSSPCSLQIQHPPASICSVSSLQAASPPDLAPHTFLIKPKAPNHLDAGACLMTQDSALLNINVFQKVGSSAEEITKGRLIVFKNQKTQTCW